MAKKKTNRALQSNPPAEASLNALPGYDDAEPPAAPEAIADEPPIEPPVKRKRIPGADLKAQLRQERRVKRLLEKGY